MFSTFKIPLEQLDMQLGEVSNFIDNIRSHNLSRSTVSYNAVIISIYGCYENYVNLLVEELICQISDNSSDHTEIPTDMRITNINRSSEFLIAGQRYRNFNLEKDDVINNIYTGKITNKLLLKHSGNLSITVLSDYMKSLGIKDVAQSIKNSKEYQQYFSEKKMISVQEAKSYLNNLRIETAFALLDDIISQRNTIAHSWKSDDKVDYSIIKDEWIEFIQIICKCLNNTVIQFYSEWLITHNKLFSPLKHKVYGSSVVGFSDVISHWNGNNKTIIVELNGKIHISKVLNVQTHNNYQVSMKFEGPSLNKDKSDNYSFYFDKSFLEAHTSLSDESFIS